MTILRLPLKPSIRLLLVICAGLSVVAMGMNFLFFDKLSYDVDDADYAHYERVFDRLEKDLRQRAMNSQDGVDFSLLNNGNWKTVCLFGGYTNPVDELQKLGAIVAEADRDRLTKAGSRGFRLAQVEEFEVAIAYIDHRNTARFIHFEHGIGPDGQHFHKCISRPTTTLFLAAP